MDEYKRINFVQSRNDLEVTSSSRKKQKHNISQLDGAAVKSFYEELVGLNEQTHKRKNLASCYTEKSTKRQDTENGTKRQDTEKGIKREDTEKGTERPNITNHFSYTSSSGSREFSRKKSSRITRSSSLPESYTDLGTRKAHRELIQSCPDIRALNRWLRAAQEGDCTHVARQLDSGYSVDLQDDFGWTALMCAAHAGHAEVLELLLGAGAAAHLTNTQGHTALSLARKARRYAAVKVLTRHSAGRPLEDPVDPGSQETFYCPTCQQEFKDTPREQHETSTMHQFSLNREPVSTSYFLTEANKGFQMMLREGWDKDHGLGPSGSGQKFPVKTVLKRDRKGLGKEAALKAKVTHFAAGDAEAVKRPTSSGVRVQREKTLSKKQREQQLRQQRKKEIGFRREFYMSDF